MQSRQFVKVPAAVKTQTGMMEDARKGWPAVERGRSAAGFRRRLWKEPCTASASHRLHRHLPTFFSLGRYMQPVA